MLSIESVIISNLQTLVNFPNRNVHADNMKSTCGDFLWRFLLGVRSQNRSCARVRWNAENVGCACVCVCVCV